jgi:phosphoglycerate dehydrogenase-like enzyme
MDKGIHMFRVGITRDFLKPDGTCGFGDIGIEKLSAAGLSWEYLHTLEDEVSPEVADEFDGLLVLGPQVTEKTVGGARRLLAVARFGVGYDNVDVPACTAAGVLLTITPDGVRRPVAVAALTFLLALSHKLLVKDRLTRTGRWAMKLDHIGQGVTGRVLGIIGLGNIGRELAELARPLGLRIIAYDPWVGPEAATSVGVELVSLEDLLRRSNYVCVCCALTEETRHMLDEDRLTLMKQSAYLINVARGAIVDQAALTRLLAERRIAGAGLDVFEREPIDPNDPLLALDNVILAPHAICWTDECFQLNGRSAATSLIDVAAGRVPRHVVNREALAHDRLRRLVPAEAP